MPQSSDEHAVAQPDGNGQRVEHGAEIHALFGTRVCFSSQTAANAPTARPRMEMARPSGHGPSSRTRRPVAPARRWPGRARSPPPPASHESSSAFGIAIVAHGVAVASPDDQRLAAGAMQRVAGTGRGAGPCLGHPEQRGAAAVASRRAAAPTIRRPSPERRSPLRAPSAWRRAPRPRRSAGRPGRPASPPRGARASGCPAPYDCPPPSIRPFFLSPLRRAFPATNHFGIKMIRRRSESE